MLITARLLIVFCLLLAGDGLSQELYSGEVSVPDQSVAEREAAIPDALIQVLQKLSGRRDLPSDPALETALDNPARMLLAFQYREVERSLPDGTRESGLRLVARFVPEAVDELLRELQLPRWRQQREPVVVWAVVDDGRGRMLMPVEYQYVYDTVQDVARLRGLPIAWPDLSEELREAIDLQLLWGGYTDQLMVEGAHSGGVAVIAARREGPEWNLRWTYADRVTESSWRTRDTELTTAMVEGLHQLTDLVASTHSVAPAGLGNWQVEVLVGGMRNGADYARSLNYLQALSVVDRVRVLAAQPGSVRFLLDLNAEPEHLARSIDLDGVLEAENRENVYRVSH